MPILTSDNVKKEIKQKFGTITKFAVITGQDRYELQKLFARKSPDKEDLQRIMNLVQNRVVKPTEKEISQALRNKLKKALKDYGGVSKFVRDNPSYSKTSILQIQSGHRKHMTDTVKTLFLHLNIITE